VVSLEDAGVAKTTGTQSVVPPLHGCPVTVLTPHAAVHSQPLQADTTCSGSASVPKYQLLNASLIVMPSTRNDVNVGCPLRQCARQVALKTPVPAGSAAMSARVPVWNSFTNANCAGVAGASAEAEWMSCLRQHAQKGSDIHHNAGTHDCPNRT
jgi:hypothetical protein